jgi:putative hydrolase of the HAD superfamily
MTQARSTWVVFDYGGVICTPQPDEDVALLAAAAGVPVPDFQAAYWAYRLSWDRAELDRTTYWHKVAAALGMSFSMSQIAELTRLDIASWLHLRDGTVALIEDLVRAGYPLALLSNAPAEVAEVVADLPVACAFSHRAFSCFLGSAKPEPECYQAVLSVLGAQPADVVFIDDRPENVAAAAGLGIRGVRFSTAPQARTALAAHGVTATPRG